MITNEAMQCILSRRSIRAYKRSPIPQEILAAILEAGQAAPYVAPGSRHFSVIQERNIIHRLSAAAKTEGRKISDFHRELFSAPGFDGTYGAPAVIIVSGNKSTVQHESVCAASVQNMLIAAHSLGISSCWAYFPIFAFHGQENEMWREKLRIPKEYSPCAAVLLGYGIDTSVEEDAERYKNTVTYIQRENDECTRIF